MAFLEMEELGLDRAMCGLYVYDCMAKISRVVGFAFISNVV
jgi:hypothetical protein